MIDIDRFKKKTYVSTPLPEEKLHLTRRKLSAPKGASGHPAERTLHRVERIRMSIISYFPSDVSPVETP